MRVVLMPQKLGNIWQAGRTLSVDQAIGYALETLELEPTPVPIPKPGIEVKPSETRSAPAPAPADLNSRELEVLRLVASGLINLEIAEKLVVSPRTVDAHLSAIYSKIGVKSRSAATRFAFEAKLTGPP